MIGYYVHHHGRGHLVRAEAIARASEFAVTGLSTLARPDNWAGDWVDLPSDADVDSDGADPTAQGRLHWAPLRSIGLRTRAAAISAWIEQTRPRAFVVDVSVEVALLARLHGIPVVAVAMAGRRGDAAHRLGFDVATSILATWPPGHAGLVSGLSPAAARRVRAVGPIGRHAPTTESVAGESRRVLVLSGAGGDDFTAGRMREAAADAPTWTWTRLGGDGRWVDDPQPHLRQAAVVVTHAGEGAIADVSAARRPAIIVPQQRPHGEQHATARALRAAGLPVIVLDRLPRTGWTQLLERASALDGRQWSRWNDGGGADRAAALIATVAGRREP